MVDAADRHDRDLNRMANLTQYSHALDHPNILLDPGGEDHSRPHIVGTVPLGLLRLLYIAGGDTENFMRPDETPRRRRRHILLPDMNAIGVHREGDIYAVIHNENGAMPAAQV